MPQRPRLAVISTHTSPLARAGTKKAGGMNVYVTDLSHALADAGWDVDVFTRRDRPDAPQSERLANGIQLFHVDAGPPEPLTPMQIAPLVSSFTEQVMHMTAARGGYDLVHSHYWLSGLSGIELARRWRCPHIAMFHTLGAIKQVYQQPEPELRIEGERRVVDCSDVVIAATAHERAFLISQYGAEPSRVRVIPCGIDLSRFHPHGAEVQLKQPANTVRQLASAAGPSILFLGRLEAAKGADLLVRALPMIQTPEPATLWIVGGDERDDRERRRLQQLAEDCGVADRVRMLDAIDHDQLPDLYRAATVCAVPSAYESFGLVAVEAMAVGTPVVATRIGGLASTISHGETGLLVDERTPEHFAAALERLLADQAWRHRISEAAIENVATFSWRNVADSILGVYADLLSVRAQAMREPCCPDAVESLLAAVGY